MYRRCGRELLEHPVMLPVEEEADQVQHVGPRHARPGLPSRPRDESKELVGCREVHHRALVDLRAYVEDIPVVLDESDPRRTAVGSRSLELGVELELGAPILRLEGAQRFGDLYRSVVGGRVVGPLDPVRDRLRCD